jgi:hypothetical protein
MKPAVRPGGILVPGLLLLVAAAVLDGGGIERTLFKDMPGTDPVRVVVEAVFASPFCSAGGRSFVQAWSGEDYAEAWARARRYFPGDAYYVRPGTYFMTHGFGPDGRLFMEIHESAYLTLCVENLRTFTPASVSVQYARMLGAADGREAAAFREKTGRLEPSFRDEQALGGLRIALGEDLFLRLLEALRRENYHMIAGGLLHEGMHAGMEDVLVARVQAEFGAPGRTIQWDELRAFMAEAGYHERFSRWAGGEIAGGWSQIADRLGRLEPLRKKARLRPGKERARFDRVRAGAWVHAALIRLRMREIWQSARRIEGLVESFRKDYVKAGTPADLEGSLAELARGTSLYAATAGEAIGAGELALLGFEEVLDQWGEWADGLRPFPPPVTDSNAAVRQARAVSWPDPPGDEARALMKMAEEALAKERTLAREGRRAPTSARRPACGPASSAG